MRIALFADFNSSFARDWVRAVEQAGHTTATFSSTRADVDLAGLAVPTTWPVKLRHKLAGVRRSANANGGSPPPLRFALIESASFVSTLSAARQMRPAIERFQPDIIHCLRLPFETIAMARYKIDRPVVASVWGNDFTLHASNNRVVRHLTQRTVRAIDGLHADAERDIGLAWEYGLQPGTPTLVAPGSGGVPTEDLLLKLPKSEAKQRLGVPPDATLVVNPRGVRSYIDSTTFPRVATALASDRMRFVDVAVESREGWHHCDNRLELRSPKTTTGKLDRAELFLLFRAADIVVSPSSHDGLPNSIVEAMGSGAAPILSNLDSTNHLTEDGNGATFELNATDGAGDIVQVLEAFHRTANYEVLAERNQNLVCERLSRTAAATSIDRWYHQVVERVTS